MSAKQSSALSRDPLPLRGAVVVVTGVSRRAGIGYAVACRAAAYGASLVCHHYCPHDDDQPWGSDDIPAVMGGVRGHLAPDARMVDVHADLADPTAPSRVIQLALDEFGGVDAVVCNQAMSGSDGALREVSAEDLDRHWTVNARASLLLAQAFAQARGTGGRGRSITFMTSGQAQGPMPGEVAYATSKAALAGITLTLADELGDQGIRVNTVNPGPVDTGYMDQEILDYLQPMFPGGRVGLPDDPARLITWLLTEEASWMTGQVINAEGGFARWRAGG